MKIILLALAALTSHAETIPPAPHCGSLCSEPMRAILEDFQEAGSIATANLPEVFSGECYHMAREYKAGQAHHGFLLIDTKQNQFFMGGAFSFFARENPYSSLTIEAAQERTPRRFNDANRLTVTQELAYSDMNRDDPQMPWKYWIKQNEATILLLAQWGFQHQVYCRFQKNP